MSCDKWFYRPDLCDDAICPGDCDACDIPKTAPFDDESLLDEETEKEIELEILAARKGTKGE